MLCLGNLHVTDYSNASATGMYDPYIVSSTCGTKNSRVEEENVLTLLCRGLGRSGLKAVFHKFY